MTALLERLLAGDTAALARSISLVESGAPAAEALVEGAYARSARARTIGLTGPPGGGKSTLAGELIRVLRERGRRVAVLSVDPSSAFSGGALLGDRVRLTDHFLDDGVFIRSMASRGALGGLSAATLPALALLGAAGYADVLVETVGVGQNEIDVVHHADTVALVLTPASGDAVQAVKAGVMEIADVFVVNQADRDGADSFARELRRAARGTPVIKTIAPTGEGVEQLLDALVATRQRLAATGELERRRRRAAVLEVSRIAAEAIERRVSAALENSPVGRSLIDAVAARRLDPRAAAQRLDKRSPMQDCII